MDDTSGKLFHPQNLQFVVAAGFHARVGTGSAAPESMASGMQVEVCGLQDLHV